uniref:UPAR/Ly6 domain-containing protein n=1 Tax=Periophthalmus magnuspinnatus TaxID=409849 RepID=A0A3B4B1H1_9GOBI
LLQLLLLLLLLLLYCDNLEALKCNRCIPSSGGRCYNTVETCTRSDDVCASAVTKPTVCCITVYSYFKRCMKASDAFILNASPHYQVFTCTTDLCN